MASFERDPDSRAVAEPSGMRDILTSPYGETAKFARACDWGRWLYRFASCPTACGSGRAGQSIVSLHSSNDWGWLEQVDCLKEMEVITAAFGNSRRT